MDEGDEEAYDDKVELNVSGEFDVLTCERVVRFCGVLSRGPEVVSGGADEVVKT